MIEPPPVQVTCQPFAFPRYQIRKNHLKRRPIAILLVHTFTAMWLLIPLAFYIQNGTATGSSLLHWISTGALPFSSANSKMPELIVLATYLRFCLPMLCMSMLTEVLYAIRK